MITVLCVVGATASGKTDLSIRLAKALNGEIVSCDSVQIYKYFNIGSAKPTLEEQKMVPHHLIDILEPSEQCNAGFWKNKAIEIIENIHRRGKLPIIAGGTGLYLKSLYLGMFEQNSRNDEYRTYLNDKIKVEGTLAFYNTLKQLDPHYAEKISPSDTLRIVRALEAIFVTKIPFSDLHKYNTKPNWQWYFTQPPTSRENIYQRIEQRINKMLQDGLIDEVQNIINQFGNTSPVFNTIGYRHALMYLNNKYSLSEMKNELILDTRHFAKRQLTLFRSLLKEEKMLSEKEILEGDLFL